MYRLGLFIIHSKHFSGIYLKKLPKVIYLKYIPEGFFTLSRIEYYCHSRIKFPRPDYLYTILSLFSLYM